MEHPLKFPDPDPVVEVYKRDVDVTLIRENLKLTPQQRVDKMIAVAKFADDLRRAGHRARATSRKDERA